MFNSCSLDEEGFSDKLFLEVDDETLFSLLVLILFELHGFEGKFVFIITKIYK